MSKRKLMLKVTYITGAVEYFTEVFDFQSTDYGYRFKVTNEVLKGCYSRRELSYDYLDSIEIKESCEEWLTILNQ
ncbi:MAG: hypothetical protein J5656_06895 [Clostridia bacterium]|nr:hypothetical protein [Clostridia bacterium]